MCAEIMDVLIRRTWSQSLTKKTCAVLQLLFGLFVVLKPIVLMGIHTQETI